MTELDVQLAALRAQRRSPGLTAWVRSLPPFDRRSIRPPGDRDVYWINVQRRLAESDAAVLLARASTTPRARGDESEARQLIG